jgi:hypothetical protein
MFVSFTAKSPRKYVASSTDRTALPVLLLSYGFETPRSNPGMRRRFFFSPKVQTDYGLHSAGCSIDAWVL